MKAIRTITGIKRIENSDIDATIFKIREILGEQRNILIDRLVCDLPTYISYKFNVKPSANELSSLADKLMQLRGSALNIDKYESIVQNILKNDSAHVSAGPFYSEIDTAISEELTCGQLKLV